jgi:hypothetical protein
MVFTGPMLVASMPAAAAAPRACRFISLDTGRSTGSFQRAVRDASKGDRLVVAGPVAPFYRPKTPVVGATR